MPSCPSLDGDDEPHSRLEEAEYTVCTVCSSMQGQVFTFGLSSDMLNIWHAHYASNMKARCTTSPAAAMLVRTSSWTIRTGLVSLKILKGRCPAVQLDLSHLLLDDEPLSPAR